MTEDDDRVHEDVQIAAMTGAAAAARTAETLLRAQQDRRQHDHTGWRGQQARPAVDRSVITSGSDPSGRTGEDPSGPTGRAERPQSLGFDDSAKQVSQDRGPMMLDEVTADFLRARNISAQMNPTAAAEATKTPPKTTARASRRQPQRQFSVDVGR